MAEEKIMQAKEVAEYLHLHLFTVHKFAREGRIPAFKLGNDWRFKKSSLEEWIKKEEKNSKNRNGHPSK